MENGYEFMNENEMEGGKTRGVLDKSNEND